jgi:hypothetical protein
MYNNICSVKKFLSNFVDGLFRILIFFSSISTEKFCRGPPPSIKKKFYFKNISEIFMDIFVKFFNFLINIYLYFMILTIIDSFIIKKIKNKNKYINIYYEN